MAAAQTLYDEALALPEDDRARLARLLLESLEGPRDTDAEAAWNETLARRVRELDDGSVKAVDWEDARREILGEPRAPLTSHRRTR